MKKLVLILLSLTLVLCLVGCDASETSYETKTEEAPKKTEIDEVSISKILIWTDEETGVQYIVYRDKAGYGGMGGITPRLNADGTLYIEEESEDTE